MRNFVILKRLCGLKGQVCLDFALRNDTGGYTESMIVPGGFSACSALSTPSFNVLSGSLDKIYNYFVHPQYFQ